MCVCVVYVCVEVGGSGGSLAVNKPLSKDIKKKKRYRDRCLSLSSVCAQKGGGGGGEGERERERERERGLQWT